MELLEVYLSLVLKKTYVEKQELVSLGSFKPHDLV